MALWRSFHRRVFVYGQSAGGASCRRHVGHRVTPITPERPADLVPAAYALSGIHDLLSMLEVAQNASLWLDEKSACAASPLFWPTLRGRIVDAVVASLESSEFMRQGRTIVARANPLRGNRRPPATRLLIALVGSVRASSSLGKPRR
jgi:hypothetical protein